MSADARDVRRPSTRPRRRWGPLAMIVVLVGYLLYAVTDIRSLSGTVRALQSKQANLLNDAATREALVTQLNTEHDLLMRQRAKLLAEIDRLTALPPKVVVRACRERPTPLFESSYTVGR